MFTICRNLTIHLLGFPGSLRLALLCFCLNLNDSGAFADDRVVVQPTGQGSRITISGTIQDLNGREIVIHTGVGGGLKRFPLSEVIDVATAYTPAHEEARQKLKAGALTEAWEQLNRALNDEDRLWVRREILALQVRIALQREDYSKAAVRFLAITQTDPSTPHFELIPLIWTADAPLGLSSTEAQAWLRSDDPTARLIGASWLLSGSDVTLARAALQTLSSEGSPAVQRLAQAQLWRLRLSGESPPPEVELQRWEHLCDDMPPRLKAGPLFLVGRGYAARQEWLSAAAAWLWLPLEYPERRDLAAEAQWQAAQAMAEAGDLPAAIRLARELTIRFADARPASAATTRLEAWTRLLTESSAPPKQER